MSTPSLWHWLFNGWATPKDSGSIARRYPPQAQCLPYRLSGAENS